jgi:hypothetical protein
MGKVVRVTLTEDYYLEDWESRPEETLKEWFEVYPADRRHAYRDGSRIGGSRMFVSYEILPPPKQTS